MLCYVLILAVSQYLYFLGEQNLSICRVPSIHCTLSLFRLNAELFCNYYVVED